MACTVCARASRRFLISSMRTCSSRFGTASITDGSPESLSERLASGAILLHSSTTREAMPTCLVSTWAGREEAVTGAN
eukprot:4408548-Pyramimonas_sp.AAC.1